MKIQQQKIILHSTLNSKIKRHQSCYFSRTVLHEVSNISYKERSRMEYFKKKGGKKTFLEE